MEDERIKEIWKRNVVKQIDSYSESEIKAIVLKNARKAIGLSYPGIALISFLVAMTLFCMWIGLQYAPQMRVFWIVCTIILLCVVCASLFSRRKMQRYSCDMPIKDWIESRIREFDRSIGRKKGYWFVMTYGAGLLFLVMFCVVLVLTAGFSLLQTVIPFITGLVFMTVFAEIGKRSSIKRMIETRKQLQELYDQLRED